MPSKLISTLVQFTIFSRRNLLYLYENRPLVINLNTKIVQQEQLQNFLEPPRYNKLFNYYVK